MVGFRPVAIQIQGHVRLLYKHTFAWADRLFSVGSLQNQLLQKGIIRLLLQDALQLVRHNYGTFAPQPDLYRIQRTWFCCWSAEVLQAVLVYGVLASVLGDELSLSCEGSDTKGGNLRMDYVLIYFNASNVMTYFDVRLLDMWFGTL